MTNNNNAAQAVTTITCSNTGVHDRTNVKRGEIWHIAKGKTGSTGCEMWSDRPALIVSNDVDNARAGFVNVVYLTTKTNKHKTLPYHIKVWSGNREATALCEQIHTVDKSRIDFYVGSVTEEELQEIDKALMFSLGISNTANPGTLYIKWANAVSRYDIDLSENPNEEEEHTDGAEKMYRILYEHERDMHNRAELTVQGLKKLCLEASRQNSTDRENIQQKIPV